MNKNFLTHDEHRMFNEIVFENRNKAYGAYVLRNEANVMLQRAFLIGVAFFSAIVIVPLVIAKLKPTPVIIADHGPFILKDIQDEVPIDKSQPQVIKPKPTDQLKTQSLDAPNPTRKAVEDQTINPKDNDALISDRDRVGTPVVNQNPILVTPGPEVLKTDVTPKADPNAIVASVDVEANFTGGIEAFRNKVLQNFDTMVVNNDSGEIIKGTITFIVEKDGTITNVKASSPNTDFSREAEKTIKNIKGKWIPAKLKGEAVRSYFRFPISMQFD